MFLWGGSVGSVILEVPAHPVVEGHDVILHCRNKKSQTKHIADFYKNGVQLTTWYESYMTIRNVSKSDEGLYKCRISGAGESPESWLAVLNQSNAVNEEIRTPHRGSPDLLSLLWVVVCALLVALLLVVMGPLLCWKHRGTAMQFSRNYVYIVLICFLIHVVVANAKLYSQTAFFEWMKLHLCTTLSCRDDGHTKCRILTPESGIHIHVVRFRQQKHLRCKS